MVPVDKNDVGYRELPETDGKQFLSPILMIFCILVLTKGPDILTAKYFFILRLGVSEVYRGLYGVK